MGSCTAHTLKRHNAHPEQAVLIPVSWGRFSLFSQFAL